MTSPARLGIAALALALFAAAMWFAWLGWDDDYYEVDGVQRGRTGRGRWLAAGSPSASPPSQPRASRR